MILNISNRTSFISIDELNLIFSSISSLDDTSKENPIIINFSQEVKRFDIIFLAGLFLYYRRFGTSYEIHFNRMDNNRIFEVRQYLMLLTKLYGIPWKDIFRSFQYITELKEETDYVASGSFAPILLINRDTIEDLFTIRERGIFNNLGKKYISNLLAGHYNNNEELAYINNPDNPILKILTSSAPIYSFVFSILYRKILPFTEYKSRNIPDPVERTIELWNFTQEFVAGLMELAKNIVEHSEHGEGVITIRAYDAENPSSSNKELETYVFDFGSIGIIPQLTQNTRQKNNPVFLSDLEILSKGFFLKDFIKPNVKKKLNQQLYRELAHYGLMKFFNLINRNNGTIITASKGTDGNRDYYSSGIDDKNKTISLGTSFYFQLPFLPHLFRTDSNSVKYSRVQHASNQMITALSEILMIKLTKDPQSHSDEKKLLDMKLTPMQIRNRDDEEELCSFFLAIKENEKIQYLAVDMDNIDLSSSSLLRFLSFLSTELSQAVIVYNIRCDRYQTLIQDNKLYFELIQLQQELPYWYADKGILIFSHLPNSKFSFADILYGSNEQEFYTINNIVSHTFPNTSTICYEYNLKDSDFDIPECLQSFFYQSSLLPFDLILENTLGENLFQNNLEIILNQKIYK